MVNVGIAGAETKLAGEIIRILINHPETELISLWAPTFKGRDVSSVHHGLIGENTLNFTDNLKLEELDSLIILPGSLLPANIKNQLDNFPELKTIVVSNDEKIKFNFTDSEIGISELNRKSLVRDAKNAYIPSGAIIPSLVALAPPANFLLLNSDIKISVSMPKDLADSFNKDSEISIIEQQLKQRQSSFSGKIDIEIHPLETNSRELSSEITFKSSLPTEELEKIYEGIYDDHNFTFITKKTLTPEEASGTQKILININKPEPDIFEIRTIADARMRGGAGDVVHILNLFFRLHEKTGLNLKSAIF